MEQNEKTETPEKKSRYTQLMKRFGMLGFLFFLIKGLIWVGVALVAGKTLFD